jgi:hypothetical protein
MTILAAVGVILLCIIVVAAVFALEVWVLMFAWNIFVSPYFSMPELTVWPAIGLAMLVNIIGSVFRTTITKKE